MSFYLSRGSRRPLRAHGRLGAIIVLLQYTNMVITIIISSSMCIITLMIIIITDGCWGVWAGGLSRLRYFSLLRQHMCVYIYICIIHIYIYILYVYRYIDI